MLDEVYLVTIGVIEDSEVAVTICYSYDDLVNLMANLDTERFRMLNAEHVDHPVERDFREFTKQDDELNYGK